MSYKNAGWQRRLGSLLATVDWGSLKLVTFHFLRLEMYVCEGANQCYAILRLRNLLFRLDWLASKPSILLSPVLQHLDYS